MSQPETIRVMISSRCTDEIAFRGERAPLSVVRGVLKAELESERLFSSPLFEVWINEDAPPAPGTDDSWDLCMKQVKEADVVLVLYNGVSGWAAKSGDIGICHGELQTAMAYTPGKVRLIELPLGQSSQSSKERDKKFQDFVSALSLFRGAKAETGEDAIVIAKRALRDSVPDLVRLGVREATRGRTSFGPALDWSRLNYAGRRQATIGVLQASSSLVVPRKLTRIR